MKKLFGIVLACSSFVAHAADDSAASCPSAKAINPSLKLMKKYLACIMLLSQISFSFAQSDVYVCFNADGSKEYRNTGGVKGCKRVELPEPEIGMKRAEVVNMLGDPAKISFIKTRVGKSEKWFYADGMVLTFSNGILEIVEKR